MEQEGQGEKSALQSKTLHFNVWTAAVWPFLPHSFRDHDWAMPALLAWMCIGNIILRFVTKEAIRWSLKKRETSG